MAPPGFPAQGGIRSLCLSRQQYALQLLLQAAIPTCCLLLLSGSTAQARGAPSLVHSLMVVTACFPRVGDVVPSTGAPGRKELLRRSEAVLKKCSASSRTVVPTGLLKAIPIKSRASFSLTGINSSDCSARSVCDGFSIISTAQLRLEEKIIRPHSTPLNLSVPSKSTGRG